MGNVIQAGVCATALNAEQASGFPNQGHLFYASGIAKWVACYLSSTNFVSFKYSSDLVTWAAPSSFQLGANHNNLGTRFAFLYKNISGVDVLWFGQSDPTYNLVDGAIWGSRYTLGASSITQTQQPFVLSTSLNVFGSPSMTFDSSNYIVWNNPLHPIITGAADLGTSWSFAGSEAHMGTSAAGVNVTSVHAIGSRNLLACGDTGVTGSTGNWTAMKWNGSSWTSTGSIFSSSFDAQTALNVACTAMLSVSDVHAVAYTGSGAFVHNRWDGANWDAGQTIPALTIASHGGVFLVADAGSNAVFLYAIEATTYSIKRSIWTGGVTPSWTSWVTIDAGDSTHARGGLTGYQSLGNGKVGLSYAQVNVPGYWDLISTVDPLGASGIISLAPLSASGSGSLVSGGGGGTFTGNGGGSGTWSGITLGMMTPSASGAFQTTVSSSILNERIVASGSGSSSVQGTGPITLLPISLSGSGTASQIGNGSIALLPITTSGSTGNFASSSSTSITLRAATMTGVANFITAGTGDVTMPGIIIASVGTATGEILAHGSITLNVLEISAEAFSDVLGDGTITLGESITVDSSGLFTTEATSDIALAVLSSDTSTANFVTLATGPITIGNVTVSESFGDMLTTGVASILMADTISEGVVSFMTTSSSDIIIRGVIVASRGVTLSQGSCDASLQPINIASEGGVIFDSVGILGLENDICSGAGSLFTYGTGSITL